jgi:hypothetical protein
MIASHEGLYPTGETEAWVLFDLRDAGSVELIHRERARWQGQSDIEALDEDRFVLVIGPGAGGARELAA